MLFSVLLLSFIIGEFCLEFIVLYDNFADLGPSWKISCQGDPTWGDVYPYDQKKGTFTPYWKTNDCETLILPGGITHSSSAADIKIFSNGLLKICAPYDQMCNLFKAGSEGIKGTLYLNLEEKTSGLSYYCNSLLWIEFPAGDSYYNLPVLFSSKRNCIGQSEKSGFVLSSSKHSLGSTVTPREGSEVKSLVISNPQDEPTEGDRYIFKVDFSGLSTPWFMVHMCAKKKARKECFSDKTVVLEKDSFGNFSLSIGKSSVDGDAYIQISVYKYSSKKTEFTLDKNYVHFTHRFIKKAEKELEPRVFPYTSSTGFNVYLHMLHCSSDYTDCDTEGTRSVVVTIFGIIKGDQAKQLLVQGVKTTADFTCVVTSHTCSGTVTALLHKSTMFNYTPQKGCLGMLPPRTSRHLFKCGGIFIQIKE